MVEYIFNGKEYGSRKGRCKIAKMRREAGTVKKYKYKGVIDGKKGFIYGKGSLYD